MREIAILQANKEKSLQRDEFFDIAKGLAIVLMVVGHACIEGGRVAQWLHDFIYTFHMPFFMIVSGYLFNESSITQPGKYIKRKFKVLYLQFVIYNIILILLNNVFWNIGIINADYSFFKANWQEYSFFDIAKRITQTLFSFANPENTGLAIWYLKDLFLTAVLFLLLLRVGYVKSIAKWLPVVFLVLAVGMPEISIPIINVKPKRLFCDLFLYSVGYWLQGKNIRLRWHIIIGCVFLSAACATWLPFAELQYPVGNLKVLRFLLLGVIGFFWYTALCRRVYEKHICNTSAIKHVLLRINKCAIPIIALHVVVFKAVTFAIWGGVSSYNVTPPTDSDILWIFYVILGIAVPYGIIELYYSIKSKFMLKLQ